jgi:hypothetical protein
VAPGAVDLEFGDASHGPIVARNGDSLGACNEYGRKPSITVSGTGRPYARAADKCSACYSEAHTYLRRGLGSIRWPLFGNESGFEIAMLEESEAGKSLCFQLILQSSPVSHLDAPKPVGGLQAQGKATVFRDTNFGPR